MSDNDLFKESDLEEYEEDIIDKLIVFLSRCAREYKDIKSKEKSCYFGNFISKLIPVKGEDISYYLIKNRKSIIVLLLSFILLGNANENDKNSSSNCVEFLDTPSGYELLLNDGYKLARTYKVKDGDTLSSISSDFNVSIEDIILFNNLYSHNLRINQIINIPYYVSKTDLANCTISVNLSDYENFEKIAEAFKTDLRTLYSLNVGKFVCVDGEYSFVSDTILVPIFPENNYSLVKSIF